jgi:hypothetical protein
MYMSTAQEPTLGFARKGPCVNQYCRRRYFAHVPPYQLYILSEVSLVAEPGTTFFLFLQHQSSLVVF